MPIADKIAAARQIDALLKSTLSTAGFRLRYRITVDPPPPPDRDWERPDIVVDFSGPDSPMLLERSAELLRSFETLCQEILRLPGSEHDKLQFDCMNYRATRLQELQMAAQVAAERVRKTGMPYQFNPMSSRERRVIHLALRNEPDLKTESQGEGLRRALVVIPKDYNPAKQKSGASFRRRR